LKDEQLKNQELAMKFKKLNTKANAQKLSQKAVKRTVVVQPNANNNGIGKIKKKYLHLKFGLVNFFGSKTLSSSFFDINFFSRTNSFTDLFVFNDSLTNKATLS